MTTGPSSDTSLDVLSPILDIDIGGSITGICHQPVLKTSASSRLAIERS
jgi:hypothetical protein